MKELKIEAVKYYRTRSGHKVRIYATDGGGKYTVHGAVCLDNGAWGIDSWALDGAHSSEIKNSRYDIVGEWEQTAIL